MKSTRGFARQISFERQSYRGAITARQGATQRAEHQGQTERAPERPIPDAHHVARGHLFTRPSDNRAAKTRAFHKCQRAHVRYGSLADIRARIRDVRFTP